MAGPIKVDGIKVIPKAAKSAPSQNSAFQQALDRLPAWKKYATQVKAAAEAYKVDPVILLAFFATENAGANPGASSSVGALGLAQIYDTSASAVNAAGVPFPNIMVNGKPVDPANLTPEVKKDPNFAINYLAWRVSGQLQVNGNDVRKAYEQYNPGYYEKVPNATGPDGWLAGIKNYTPAPSLSPDQTAVQQQVARAASLAYTDPYVDASGTPLRGVSVPPTNGIPSQTGDQMRLSEFNSIAKNLNEIYFAYTGANATPEAVASYAAGRTSTYELKKRLAERPEFTKSPVYQERAGDYVSIAKDVYGQKFSVPKDLLARAISTGMNQGAFTNELRNLPGYGQSEEFRKQASKYTATARQIFGPRYTPPAKVIKDAVVSGLTPDDFAAQLRGSKDYENSNEFKQMYSGLYGTYAQVYGRPDDQGKLVVKEAAKQGWSAEQFGQYLRSQDAYTQSPEYQSKALGFLDAMGLITGDTPVLRQGMAPQNREAPMAGPNDPAVGPPAPGVKRKPGKSLVAGFAGTRGGDKLYG